MDFLFLIPLLAIAGLSCYTDIKYSKIKNRLILGGFILGFFLYLWVLVYYVFYLGQPQVFGYLKDVLINFLFSFLAGYALWKFNFWGAGDAKLFMLFALLTPLNFYSKAYFPFFPSIALLTNIFFLLIFYLIVRAVFATIKDLIKEKKEGISFFLFIKNSTSKGIKARNLRIFSVFILIFITLRLLIQQLIPILNRSFPYPVLFFAVSLVLYHYLFKFLAKRKKFSSAIIIILFFYIFYYVFWGDIWVLINNIKTSVIFLTLVVVINRLLFFYVESKDTVELKIGKLQEGMFFSMDTLWDLSKKFKKKSTKEKFVSKFKNTLTQEQVAALKNLFSDDPEKKITVYKNSYFSPFLLLGLLITILTKNSLFYLLNFVVNDLFK